MRYIKKPVVIEAIQWDGNNTHDVLVFCEGNASLKLAEDRSQYLLIQTLESNGELKTRHAAAVNDYIIKGIKEEFYPCKPDIFSQTYASNEPQTQHECEHFLLTDVAVHECDCGSITISSHGSIREFYPASRPLQPAKSLQTPEEFLRIHGFDLKADNVKLMMRLLDAYASQFKNTTCTGGSG